jgi:hypothetical protein
MWMGGPSQVVTDAAQPIPDESDGPVNVGGRTAEGRAKPANRGIVADIQLNAIVAVGDVHDRDAAVLLAHAT